jgi:hypothetical protein
MLTGRTEASISQDQPGRVPPDRPRLERIAKSSQGFGEGGALPCEEFLYDFKRRLRAGTSSGPSSPPRTGAHGSPAFLSPPQRGLAGYSYAPDLPSRGMVRGEGERVVN